MPQLLHAVLAIWASATGCHLLLPYRSAPADAGGSADGRARDERGADDRRVPATETSVAEPDGATPGEDLRGGDLLAPRDARPADAAAGDLKLRPAACVQNLTLDACDAWSCTGSCATAGGTRIQLGCYGTPGYYLCQCDSSAGYATCTSSFAGSLCALCAAVPDPELELCCF